MAISPQEIADLKTKLQAIIFSIEDGIVMTDFDGQILVINSRARHMLGIKKGYPFDKKFLDYIEDPAVRDQIRSFSIAPDGAPAIELNVSPDGTPIILKVTKNPVTTAQGERLGQVIALHDITLERELENLKDDFLHSITHDLKSPLTAVQGFLGLFLEGALGAVTADQQKYLKIMLHSSGKQLRMINNILDMAKLDAGRLAISKTDWNVVESVDEILQNFQEIARHHKIRVFKTVKIHQADGRSYVADDAALAAQPIIASADTELLERVLTNLVDNAMKFSPMSGEIEILIEDFPGKISISVIDNGRGIPEDALKKLFHKFQQAPGTKGGTGLGLTIAKHIVEDHGGAIGADSEPGKGSNFHFWLPKQHQPKEAARA